MATISNRGPHQWQATIRKVGFQTQSRTFETRRDALDWSKMVESEMRRGIFEDRTEAERTTFGELLERYGREVTPSKRGAKPEHSRLKRLKAHPLAMKRLAQLRSVDFADYRDERLDEEASDKTVREELLLCSTVLNTARKDWSITVENWVQHVRKPSAGRPRDRRLKGDEEQRLLSACRGCKNQGLEATVILAIETGMWRGEIAGLTWEQVDLPHKIIRLQLTKNGDARNVPLSVRAEAVFRKLSPKESGKIFAFHDSNGVGAAFARTCTREGIEDLRFHDLRHEAASRKALRMSVAHLAKVMGWRTIQMAMRYYNPHDEELVAIERGESGHGVW